MGDGRVVAVEIGDERGLCGFVWVWVDGWVGAGVVVSLRAPWRVGVHYSAGLDTVL